MDINKMENYIYNMQNIHNRTPKNYYNWCNTFHNMSKEVASNSHSTLNCKLSRSVYKISLTPHLIKITIANFLSVKIILSVKSGNIHILLLKIKQIIFLILIN